MNDQRPSFVVWTVAIALLLAAGGAYTAAYFLTSTATKENLTDGGTLRVYRHTTLAVIFIPAAMLETMITGENVSPAVPN